MKLHSHNGWHSVNTFCLGPSIPNDSVFTLFLLSKQDDFCTHSCGFLRLPANVLSLTDVVPSPAPFFQLSLQYSCISRTKEQKKGKLTFSFPLTMTMSSSSSLSHEPFTHDELSIQQSMLFSDSLKDLKHLRSQLYSAAEFFEDSYTKDNQKQAVVDTLKDYTVRALVNTVDHLGCITSKVTDLLEEKADEISGTELRVSCIEQRLRTCQECIDREGLAQQSLVMTIPKYHKRSVNVYTSWFIMCSVGDSMHGSERTASEYRGDSLGYEDSWNNTKSSARTTIRGRQPSTARKGRSPSPSPQGSLQPVNFLFTDKQKVSDKRTASPLSKFPLLRSGSFSTRPRTPNPSRPTTSNSFNTRPRYPSEPRKTSSMRLHAERDNRNDMEQYPSKKSKRLLKALLSRKSKKDEAVYTFLDEY
ncbi:hypothetical protein IFM89_033512 [Coptis chinensis]|uniref:Uncharacterized protein n=1 Tax=Coptis chinensis TaxID=261450 RepID=A0A835HA74_9MAGN|nr:hypothetical protein IFM89_033512 [Coptis chinensis]